MDTAKKVATPAVDGALPAKYRLGEYRIKSVLGLGGFGITYLARDTKLGALVAIKEYFPQSLAFRNKGYTIIPRGQGDETISQNYRWGLQEFLKEARVLAKFKHNNVVRVLRFVEGNGTAYMVMEYEEGQSLSDFLKKRGGFLDEKSLLTIFMPILSGLQAVHEAGVLHLDIKPDNIYLRANGQPMLIDFGSASQISNTGGERGAIALTPAYSAIENYPNLGRQGPWSDIYSIGATLYRCITGRHPRNAMDRYQAVQAGMPDPHPLATSLERPIYAPCIRESVDWAMELEGENRPQLAKTLQQALMGRGRFEEAEEKKSFNSFQSGYIGVVNVREKEEEQKRGPLEKLLAVALLAGVLGTYLVWSGAIPESQIMKPLIQIQEIISGEETKEAISRRVNKVVTAAEDKLLGIERQESVDQQLPADSGDISSKPVVLEDFDPELISWRKISSGQKNIHYLGFVADDTLLLSVSQTGNARLWNVATGKMDRNLELSDIARPAIALSPDASMLANSDSLGVSLRNIENLSIQALYRGHKERVTSLAISPDNQLLASADITGSLVIWNVVNKNIIARLNNGKHEITSLAFSPNGRWLASADKGGIIRYWEAKTGKALAKFPAHKESVQHLSYSPDGKWLASTGVNKFLKLWSIGITVKDRLISSVPVDPEVFRFSRDSRYILAGGATPNLLMWEIETGQRQSDILAHKNSIRAIAVAFSNKQVATAGSDNTIHFWRNRSSSMAQRSQAKTNPQTGNAPVVDQAVTQRGTGNRPGLVSPGNRQEKVK